MRMLFLALLILALVSIAYHQRWGARSSNSPVQQAARAFPQPILQPNPSVLPFSPFQRDLPAPRSFSLSPFPSPSPSLPTPLASGPSPTPLDPERLAQAITEQAALVESLVRAAQEARTRALSEDLALANEDEAWKLQAAQIQSELLQQLQNQQAKVAQLERAVEEERSRNMLTDRLTSLESARDRERNVLQDFERQAQEFSLATHQALARSSTERDWTREDRQRQITEQFSEPIARELQRYDDLVKMQSR